MLFNEAFTYSSIAFMIILIIIYYSKSMFDDARTKLFKCMIIVSSLYIVSELVPMMSLKYGTSQLVVKIGWRVHWIFAILFLWLFFDYCVVIIKKTQITNIFKLMFSDLLYKITSIIFIVFTLVYTFVFKFKGLNLNEMDYFPGNTAIYVFIFSVVILLFILVMMFKNKESTTKQEKKTIIIVMSILSNHK